MNVACCSRTAEIQESGFEFTDEPSSCPCPNTGPRARAFKELATTVNTLRAFKPGTRKLAVCRVNPGIVPQIFGAGELLTFRIGRFRSMKSAAVEPERLVQSTCFFLMKV